MLVGWSPLSLSLMWAPSFSIARPLCRLLPSLSLDLCNVGSFQLLCHSTFVQVPCNLFGGVLFSDMGFEIWACGFSIVVIPLCRLPTTCLVRVLFSDHGFELWARGFSIVAKPQCMLHVAYLVDVLFSDQDFEIWACGFSIVAGVLIGMVFFMFIIYIYIYIYI
jgi:hypothetical protein